MTATLYHCLRPPKMPPCPGVVHPCPYALSPRWQAAAQCRAYPYHCWICHPLIGLRLLLSSFAFVLVAPPTRCCCRRCHRTSMPWWRPLLIGTLPPSPSRSIAVVAFIAVHHHLSQSPLRCRCAIALSSLLPTTTRFADPFVGVVRFCHLMLSCDRQRSRCRFLSSPIVIHCPHRRHRRSCRCRRAATTATTTTVVKLTIVQWWRKRQQQRHHQHTSCRTILKTLFNLSTVFGPTNKCDEWVS